MRKVEPFYPDLRWFEAPRERTLQFYLTFAKVSVALQQALRVLAVRHFFSDVNRFGHENGAYSLLAYAASRPYRPKSRTDFTYDVTNASMMTTFFRMSRRKLTAALTEIHAKLQAAGETELAMLYDPRRVGRILRIVKKQKRFRKSLHRLLVAEGKLLNELTAFSGLVDASPKDRFKGGSLVMKNWRATLSHLCLGTDLSGLAPELFEVATKAYLAVNEPGPMDAQPPLEELDELDEDEQIELDYEDEGEGEELYDDLQDLAA